MSKKPKPPEASKPTPTDIDELNMYQAAVLVGMSPRLLKWFSGHAPKKYSKRKLTIREDGDTFYVERQLLVDFNTWLKLPWGVPGDPRPGIPSGIRTEIQHEANGKCAICQQHGDTCEAAHLEPVAATRNNHPENLLWLCANHHTAYDKTTFGPDAENVEFVAGFKQYYASFKRLLWKQQADISGALLAILKACEALRDQLAAAATQEQRDAIEALAQQFLAEIPKTVPVSKADPGFAAFEAVAPKLKALSQKSTASKALPETLAFASEVGTEFAQRAGYVECPLCTGSGHHEGEDCPECGGEGELTTKDLQRVDLRRYEVVACPLCKGKGVFDGDECRACNAEGRMERRFADQVDVREWQSIDCPVCQGEGLLNADDCPACGGDGEVRRRDLDRIDVRDYEYVDCPLCGGSGRYDRGDCRECNGDGQMQRRHADQVDLGGYERVECRLCEGSGHFDETDCRECGGDGRVEKQRAERFEKRDYDMVKCPTCSKHAVEYCHDCGGEGSMRRWRAEQL